jgi:EAL domain-containing protein (putative c-di-GMP-specific phosphodiesterase class I)
VTVNDRVAQAALERALDEPEQLVLLYQPIHEATSGRIVSAEALLRQRRKNGELREASIIHEAAEASSGDEIFELDHHLVRKSYTEAARWQRTHPDVRLNVNISPREFEGPHVIGRLRDLVTSCGIDPAKVSIEITETHYIKHPEATIGILRALRDEGLELWLDDFGTRHSTLTHVQHFPINGLKIPAEFVATLPDDERCAAIVRSIVTMAHDLGLKLIAEGVERNEQLEFLRDLRCDYIQGFLFSKPMSGDAFEALLGGRSRAEG